MPPRSSARCSAASINRRTTSSGRTGSARDSTKSRGAKRIAPDDALVNERTTRMAQVTYRGRTMTLPVWVMPGQPDGVLTIFFGYGRKRCGKVADGVGFNTYALRDSDALHHASGVQVSGL